ncbi:MAG TPA: hypothetical protein PKO28_01940 [Bacilli bacterium]|nr:hypothetical protein [Bacilli bacterium]HPS19239.1 hypothetical protein [Bacilli bacterium]
MKKVCRIFLTVTFWLAFADLFIFLITGLLGLIFATSLISFFVPYFNSSSYDITEATNIVAILVYTFSALMIFYSFLLVGPLVVCPITKRKLAVAKSRHEMIALGVLNVFFGSIVSAILIFVMPDRYYQNAKAFDPHEELGSNE